MDTRKLKAQAYSFPTEGVGIFDEASTEIASCNKLEEAEELVKRFNAYPKHVLAFQEIQRGEGPFSTDQLTHAGNTIEAMKQLAINALAGQDVADAIPSSSGDPFTVNTEKTGG